MWLFDYIGSFSTVTDFSAAGGDRIVMTDLVASRSLGADTAAAFAAGALALAQVGAGAHLRMDEDGAGPGAAVPVMVLANTLVTDHFIGVNLI